MMENEMYLKLLHDVENLLKKQKYGDIGMGYVMLTIYGLSDDRDKIRYLTSILRNHNGATERLGTRAENSVKDFKPDSTDMGNGDE